MGDYSHTLFLPKTDFALKIKNFESEKKTIDSWKDLYSKRKSNIGPNSCAKQFVLHDGPPYANGHIHMGHAMNKILKDIIVRYHYLWGFDIDYKPGWDCHGLPIEWMVEQEYKKEGKHKKEVEVLEFRQRCRDFAAKWISIQSEEFKRIGVLSDWKDHIYTTMSFDAEASIVEQLLKFAEQGWLYEGYKPVLWSVVEGTSLAEAEVVYKEDYVSKSMIVKFPVARVDEKEKLNSNLDIDKLGMLIWTTTPWTLVCNRGIAYHAELEYSIYEVKKVNEQSHAKAGDLLLLAETLADQIKEFGHIEIWEKVHKVEDMSHFTCSHLFSGLETDGEFDFDVPLWDADFVTVEKGTGIVHIAPSHGEDDFRLGKSNNASIEETVDKNGIYKVKGWEDTHIFKAYDKVKAILEKGERLFALENYKHSYPHSWRSGAPLIYRAAKQWFLDIQSSNICKDSINALHKVQFVPERAKQRLVSTIEDRPDWLLSRQRCWGVPMTLFVHKDTGELLSDPEVNKKIVDTFKKEGGDCWFRYDTDYFFEHRNDADQYIKVEDILDVWFDSGCTHIFAIEDKGHGEPAQLYLEGSDQHRGWFQSSLLVSIGNNKRSPYKAIMSHGFALDANGRKMSKSEGNVISPIDIVDKYGADLLRLWTVSADYTRDVRVGENILKAQLEILHRFRNTIRFSLANLDYELELPDLSNKDILDNMPFIDRWILHRLLEVESDIKYASQNYYLHKVYIALYKLCDQDLSALYFDIIKDTLYCSSKVDKRRLYAQAVLHKVFHFCTNWIAPILPFMAEEAWQSYSNASGKESNESVHMNRDLSAQEAWRSDYIADQSNSILTLKKAINICLENERKSGNIGSSLDAKIDLYIKDETLKKQIEQIDMKELCIVSQFNTHAGMHKNAPQEDIDNGYYIHFEKALGVKCPRCWVFHEENSDLCERCTSAVNL